MVLHRFVLCALLLAARPAGRASAETIALPFREAFTGTDLDGAWKTDASGDNRIRVVNGSLEIQAAENTYAHIERPLGLDRVRASCAIKPGGGVSWATSLFLYWRPGDWCQMSVIPRGDGRFYTCVTANGGRTEHDLARCRYADFQNVAIELGDDCIRFMSSPDGTVWHNELFIARPATLAGPPAMLIVGKGFGVDANTPDLDGDYGDRGPAGVSVVRSIRVEATASDRLRITGEERRERDLAGEDPLGRRILGTGREPSFDAVAAVLPAMKKPREAIGAKDGRYEVGVEYDGTIQLDTGEDGWEQTGPTAWFEIGSPAVRFGTGGCKRRLVDGFLPIVVCTFEHDGLTFEQTLVGWSEGMRPDTDLWACARLAVRNAGDKERAVDVALRSKPETISRMGPLPLRVPPGGRAEVCVRVPSPAKAREAGTLEPAAFSRCLDEAAAHWTRVVGAGMQVRVPEPRVNNAWRAWLAYNFINVDRKGEVYEPHDGAGFYELVYGYSEILYCNALDLWGHHDDARRYLESMFHFTRPDGLFAINYGLPDHGGLLFALAQHYRLTGDAEWLRGVAPRMVRMCEWLIARRAEAARRDRERPNPLTAGLIRFRPYCDYAEETYNYYGNAYCCIGLEHAAGVLREIGMSEPADRIAREAAAYRKDILASMDAAVVVREGFRYLPMEPDTRRLLESTQYRGGGYYGLVASMLLECGFLPAEDPRARLVTDAMERRNGLILGMAEFDGGVDHAYTYGYWMNRLESGRIDRVLLGFYGMLAYGMDPDTFCGVEVTQLTTGEPTPTTPHLYSGTQQLRLLRMMLLREDGDVLRIGEAIPRAWLEGGKRIEVRGAPTSFGPVSFVIESAAGAGRVDARIEPPTRRPPAKILLSIRHPGGRQPSRALVDGHAAALAGDVLTLEPAGKTLSVRADYGN